MPHPQGVTASGLPLWYSGGVLLWMAGSFKYSISLFVMEINIELEDLIKEVQRKLGRNVILFQQIEHMLKYMLTYQYIKVWGTQEGIKSNLEERKNIFANQTLGNVAKQFVENAFSTSEQADESQYVSEETSKFSMSFSRGPMLCDEVFYNQRKNELTALIAERNDLIHHFLPKWNFGNYESVVSAQPNHIVRPSPL